MIPIAHRINTIEQLKEVPPQYGVEIDLRPWGENDLILAHDPFCLGENFEKWLEHYRHALLILNVKSEAIEYKIKEHLDKKNITDYFFLDSSFPMLVKLARANESNLAIRYSEFEDISTLEHMKEMAKWAWVDCFKKDPVDADSIKRIKKWGYRTCLVSPDILGRPQDIKVFIDHFLKHNIKFDAVCTKLGAIDGWETI